MTSQDKITGKVYYFTCYIFSQFFMTILMTFDLNCRGDCRMFAVKFAEFFMVERDIIEVTPERKP